MSDIPFTGDVALLAGILERMGFRLVRESISTMPNGKELLSPALAIERTDERTWPGVFRGVGGQTEIEAALLLAAEAITVWAEDRHLYGEEARRG